MPSAWAVLLAGGAALAAFGGAPGALAEAAPSAVIVPLDVTMEDTSWLTTVQAPVRSQEPHIAAPDADAPVVTPVDGEAPAVSSLALLAVQPDFSIAAPGVAASPGSSEPAAVRIAAAATRPSSTLGRDQAKRFKRTYKVNGSAIEFDIPVQLDGDLAGMVPLRIDSDRTVSVQLAELLTLLQGRMDPALHDWLGSAYSVNSHISFEQLRSAGIDVRYDAANDALVLATK